MFRSTIALGLLALAALPTAQQSAPLAQTGAISGLVVDAVSGQPIAGAAVALGRTTQNPNPPLPPRFTTDSKGRFIFANLAPADDYYLSARGPGYLSAAYGDSEPVNAIFFDRVTRIRLAAGQWVPDLTIRLWRPPVISGRVTDERGEPVVGVAIRSFSTARTAGHERLVGGPLAVTDDRGMYNILDLTPGRYVVSVLSVQSTVLTTTEEAPPVRAMGALQGSAVMAGNGSAVRVPTVDVDRRHKLAITNFLTPPPPAADRPRAYAAQFYPGARTREAATAIDVAYGKDNPNIDFRLQPEAAFLVQGRTTGPSSPGLMLRLMPVGSEGLGFGSEAATTVIERDDTFTFLNVPAGNYTLVAQSSVVDLSVGSSSARVQDAPGFPAGGAGVGSWNGAPGVSYLAQYGAGAQVWSRMAITVSQNLNDVLLPLHATAKISGHIAFADGVALPPKTTTRLLMDVEPADGDPLHWAGHGTADLADGTFKFAFDVVSGNYLISSVSGFRLVSVTVAGREVTFAGIDASRDDVNDVVVTLTDKRSPSISGTVSGPAGSRSAVLAFPVNRARWVDYGWSGRGFRVAPVGPEGGFALSSLPAGEYFIAAIDGNDFDRWPDQKFLESASVSAARITLDWGDVKTISLQRR